MGNQNAEKRRKEEKKKRRKDVEGECSSLWKIFYDLINEE